MAIATYKLTNANGMEMTVTNLGCAIINLLIPTKNGKKDIVLGLDKAEDYTKPHPFFGVIAGRFANRIGKGQFQLGGKTYQLETNDGAHHLHGGSQGFDKKIWDVKESANDKIVFVYNSPDGDANYPSNLVAQVTYTLTNSNVLRIDYYATTDSETICNLTNHSYFNLCGHDSPTISNHKLQIFADKITAVDNDLIPTGEFIDVTGTPFDFRTEKEIGLDLEAAGKISGTGGYDHNFVLQGEGVAAVAYSPTTDIRMIVSTNSPGMQLYTGNNMDGSVEGKGVKYNKFSGFCLETQIFPDAINHSNFPSCVVSSDKPQNFYTAFTFEF